jgi:16S rRNA (cytosine1402-N4)-methyltransferase
MTNETVHTPVFPSEVLHWLAPVAGSVFVDGTFGGGGHSRLLAEQVRPSGRILAFDRDPKAISRWSGEQQDGVVQLIHADFRNLADELADRDVGPVDGVLLDLGLSSDQLADADRGFSFAADGELDLRFDPDAGEPAWQLLSRLNAVDLADIIYRFGEERLSRRIARRIVEARRDKPIRTARQLSDLIRRSVPRSRNHRIDPATRTFQALRIAVNDELGALEQALQTAPDILRSGGRIAVISFHSLEDRIVKYAFRDDPRYLILTKKPIRPNEGEMARNPRSRSARLRVAKRSEVDP